MDAFLNKITGKDHPDAAHQPQVHSDSHPPPVVTEATTQTVPKKEEDHGFNFSAIKDALTGGSSSTVKQPPVPPPVAVTTNTHSEPSRDKDAWHEKVGYHSITVWKHSIDRSLVPRFARSGCKQQTRCGSRET
ncbi:hypothetical protein M408DRAFT_255160 [Serendipita vermifera MAFF 305830]|uniref:Uncharacterized protein n=1 Tax=Serendipita vermifera MAFF 305830 TaxID=933852 RepID=A0A0C3B2Y2_SERVB|nr:hypothetical protein M408DRAFT_255160 [Serendipita vermifera MAFF 305830]